MWKSCTLICKRREDKIVWERPLRLAIHFQSNLISPHQLFSFNLWVMSPEQRMRIQLKREGRMLFPLSWKKNTRGKMGEDKRHWVMEVGKQGNSCQISSFLSGNPKRLSFEHRGLSWFYEPGKYRNVWNSCNGEVGCLGYSTHMSWVCLAQSLGPVLLSVFHSCSSKA